MNKIAQVFQQRNAFIGYLTAGQGGLTYTKDAALALVKGGVDILEIGVPFSDPVADGSVIQQAMQQALENNTTLKTVLEMIADIKQSIDVPIVIFSYFNPVFKMGMGFYSQAKAAGVDGILLVDLPLEESSQHFKNCRAVDIEPICVISPTTSAERIIAYSNAGNAFLYYACRNGITGIQTHMANDFDDKMAEIKQYSKLPVAAGFGIASKENAAAALACADGFVVGSLFVKAIAEGCELEQLTQLTKQLDPR